jgi:hypothetical protein
MNWMIDGAHGDLYRRAMGFPQLKPTTDAWETERNTGRKPRRVRSTFAGYLQRLTASFSRTRETIRLALAPKETVS